MNEAQSMVDLSQERSLLSLDLPFLGDLHSYIINIGLLLILGACFIFTLKILRVNIKSLNTNYNKFIGNILFVFFFLGEFMSLLYDTFERLPALGVFASLSIVFSAAYTIYMFNRKSFGGSFTKFFEENISDVTKREFFLLITLVVGFTVILGIYPTVFLDG
jgi:hypothetical protein